MFGYYMLGYYIKAQGQFSQLFGATGHISHYKQNLTKSMLIIFPRGPGLRGHRKTGGHADVHTDARTFCLMTKPTSVESKWIPLDWKA